MIYVNLILIKKPKTKKLTQFLQKHKDNILYIYIQILYII